MNRFMHSRRVEMLGAAVVVALRSLDGSTAAAQPHPVPVTPEAFAEGLGTFLVGRAEEEVSAFGMEFFLERLCAHPEQAWSVSPVGLFPSACALVSRPGPNDETTLSRLPVALGMFRRALQDDLAKLPTNVVRTAVETVVATQWLCDPERCAVEAACSPAAAGLAADPRFERLRKSRCGPDQNSTLDDLKRISHPKR